LKKHFLLINMVLLLTACAPSRLPTQTAVTPSGEPSWTPDVHTCTPIFVPTATSTPVLKTGSTLVRPKDEMLMVYVPEGAFSMGLNDSQVVQICREDGGLCPQGWFSDEMPVHQVRLDAFWIDRTEVTNGRYAACVLEGWCRAPAEAFSATRPQYYDAAQYADYPVVNVTWSDAQDYCAWAGARLPSEAEWEKAARGTDGRVYPWGNADPDCSLANYWSQACGEKDTWQAGSLPNGASPYGALDMAGNAWEWVNDRYQADYYFKSPQVNPSGPLDGELRVVRGGTRHFPRDILATSRNSYTAYGTDNELGFRCALSAP
jgi:formylglycine-generating enzyme required for sulfatase activity